MPDLTPIQHKKLRLWVRAFFTLFVVTGLWGITDNLYRHYHPGEPVRHGHVTHVHIGGRDFAVPDEYIRGPRPIEANAKQLYLWLTLPNYAPYLGDRVESKNPVSNRFSAPSCFDRGYCIHDRLGVSI